MTEAWTIGRLLAWTTDYLKQHGSDSPRLDAEVLLASARGCQRIQLYTDFAEDAGEELRASFRELVRRRAEGTPVAYLVGHREFYSLPFHVTRDVLIPRPETELLVITLLDLLKQPGPQPTRIADVGTGSGIIAASIARHAPQAQLTAIDLSPAALAVAKKNAVELHVAERIEFVESDLFAAVAADARFDFIVSNPPYISSAEMEQLPRDVKNFEPSLALHGGPTGAEVIARLIPEAAERLTAGGLLLMEISPMIAGRVRELLAAEPRLTPGTTIKDLAGLARVAQAKKTIN